MNNKTLITFFNELGLTVNHINGKLKGKTYYVYYSWVNKKSMVTIKTRGIQKSFHINNSNELKQELARFEII